MGNAKKKIIGAVRNYASHNKLFRKSVRSIMNTYRRMQFNAGRSADDVDEKLVYFTSFSGRSYNDSPKAIYEYMLNSPNYSDYIFVWSFLNPEKYENISKNSRTSIVKTGSKAELSALRHAKYWITNYRMLDHFVPSDNQVYVQCWHGSPLKRLGYDLIKSDNAMNSLEEIREKYRTDAKRFKYILSPAEATSESFITAWNLRETGQEYKVVEEGYPRNDRLSTFSEADVSQIKENLGIPEGKKVLLYTPTWRDNQYDGNIGYTYSTNIDFDKLYSQLGDKYVILFRAHYLVANSFDFNRYSGFVLDVSAYDDINDLFIVSDCLVTDYSSTFFDYAVLKRPIYFYMYDLEEYQDEIRGFYLSLDELPGPIFTEEDELIAAIKRAGAFMPNEKYAAFNKKYNYLNDGHATERVVKRIIED